MARNYASATIVGPVSVTLNENFSIAGNFLIWRNVKESLSAMTTRRSEMPKQAAHGVEGSLSHYNARMVPFEGEIHATSVEDRVEMEQALKRCLTLANAQDYSDEDGYRLVQITDEDGIEKQIHLKLVDIEFAPFSEGRSKHSRFRFTMIAEEDVFLMAQELSTASGPESVESSSFTFQDGALPTFQDGDLPTFQDEIISLLEIENEGTIDTPPVITIHGPSVSPVVENLTTGKTMDLGNGDGLTLLENERVEIDVANQTIKHFDDEDNETDASGYLTQASEWIYLDVGTNQLSLFDDSPGALLATLDVDHRPAWL